MSVTSEISRLTALRNNFRTKLIALGVISDQSADLDDCYTGLDGITKRGAATFGVAASDRTIESGQYLAGMQTIRAVTTSGISAANIKNGVTIQVGDSADDDRITGVTGSFTAASTVSAGQTAATADKILGGYSAWVNGVEVQGSLEPALATVLTYVREVS